MKLCKNSFHIDEIFVMKNFNFKILFFCDYKTPPNGNFRIYLN